MLENTWKILLVEDDEDDFLLVKGMLDSLKKNQYELSWVQTFDDALETLNGDAFSVALIDQFLGEDTGLDVIRTGMVQNPKTPFILLTGNDSYDLDIEAARAGATDYLVKGEISALVLERAIRYAISRKKNEQEILKNAEQIEVHHRLIQQREIERLNIARELHDGPLQEIISTSFILKDALHETAETDQVAFLRQKVQEALETLQKQIRDIRTFCSDLRPPSLTPYGLAAAIRSHLDKFQDKHPNITFYLALDQDRQSLPEHVRLALFRIYQELMNNIIRHSEAFEVSIRLSVTEDNVEIEVSDNGIGFYVPRNWLDFARSGHLGMVGILERADAVGGIVTINSEISKGTSVVVSVPCSKIEASKVEV
ncbi:MAG: response regulator [Chloroflexi bacterium]|nr:MAG: response regulator [Chloroflexota bacterium]